jgi:nicotinamidase-related amidase
MPYRVERIDPRRTAMIVVDMENDFGAPVEDLRVGYVHFRGW